MCHARNKSASDLFGALTVCDAHRSKVLEQPALSVETYPELTYHQNVPTSIFFLSAVL